MRTAPVQRKHFRSQQRGVVLLISLIMLIALTLVGVSMLRSVGVGAGIAGNLAFKQNATAVADLGVEISRTWLVNKGAAAPLDLNSDAIAASGYFSCWYADCTLKTEFNPLTYNWVNSKKMTNADAPFIDALTGKDNTGNEVRYVVHRLCDLTGEVLLDKNPLQKCANFTDYSGLGSKGGSGYGQALSSLSDQPYFRATVRVTGPRNTLSYIQVIMY
jgi:type IV pilus assembly protein PilX